MFTLVALEASIFEDEDLPEAEKVANTWQNLAVKRNVPLEKLQYPKKCNSQTLRNFATKCGLDVRKGGKHWKVYDGKQFLTPIPHSVKENPTCQNIINVLNGRCT